MKSLFVAVVLAAATPAIAFAGSLEEALARYVAWRGGGPFQNAAGIVVRGEVDNGRFKGVVDRRVEPGRTMEHIVLGSADIHGAFIGEGGWTVTLSGQVEDAGAPAAREAARRRLTLFDDALDGRHGRLSLEPDERLDGRQVQVLRVTFSGDSRYDLLLEPATGSLLAERVVEEGVPTLTRFDDWRMVEGVRIPFRQVQQTDGEGIAVTTVLTHVDIDPAPDPAAFERPVSRRIYSFPEGRSRTQPLTFDLFLGARINIPAIVNGRQTTVMMDSGAEVTVLDKSFADSLGIQPTGLVGAVGTGGRDTAELASGVSIRLGDVELKDLTVALMDLKPIAAGIGRPLPVILGKEVLNALTVEFDFAARTITFHDPARYAAPSDAVAVPVSNVGGLHAIPVSIEGGEPALMHFDLGNGSPLLVYPNLWKPAGMLTGRPVSQGMSGGVGGVRARTVATVRSLTLAGAQVRDVPAVFGEEDDSVFSLGHTFGNIGMPILSRFHLTTDYARNRLLLKPRAEALGDPFTKDRAGALARLIDGMLQIAVVAPGSPAEAAGLKAGQGIVAVNGKPADEVGMAGYTALRTAAPGERLALMLDNGETAVLTLRDYY